MLIIQKKKKKKTKTWRNQNQKKTWKKNKKQRTWLSFGTGSSPAGECDQKGSDGNFKNEQCCARESVAKVRRSLGSREHYEANIWWLSGERILLQRRRQRSGFNPWVGKIPWRKKWQPTPVFLPGASHGQRSLVTVQWIAKDSDTTEHKARAHTHNIWLTYLRTCLLSKNNKALRLKHAVRLS